MEIKPLNLNSALTPINTTIGKDNNAQNNKTQKIQGELVNSNTSNAIKSYAITTIELQKLKQLQKTFQDVFLNPDISIGEAKIMFDRYKEIEKIEDKTEYTKALFEEAKRNFGFKNSKIE